MSAVINPHQNQAPANPNLHLQVNLLGVGFLAYALITSYLLYGSFGVSSIEVFTYRLLGVLLCFSTAIMLRLCYQLWAGGNSYLSFSALILYFCLFSIEWSTGVGFASNALSHVRENSGASAVVNEQAKVADIKLNQFAQFSGLSIPELTTNKTNLTAKITTLSANLSACPARDYTHCQKPKRLKIEQLNIKLASVNNDLKNANQYNFALEQKQNALNAVSNPVENVSNYHPLFKVQSKLFNLEIKETEANYLGFSSLIATILTSILFLMGGVLKNRFVLVPAQTEQNNRPALSSNQAPQGFSFLEAIKQKFIDRLNLKK